METEPQLDISHKMELLILVLDYIQLSYCPKGSHGNPPTTQAVAKIVGHSSYKGVFLVPCPWIGGKEMDLERSGTSLPPTPGGSGSTIPQRKEEKKRRKKRKKKGHRLLFTHE